MSVSKAAVLTPIKAVQIYCKYSWLRGFVDHMERVWLELEQVEALRTLMAHYLSFDREQLLLNIGQPIQRRTKDGLKCLYPVDEAFFVRGLDEQFPHTQEVQYTSGL